MPATISHQLSATTPDDPSYEIRPSHWNSSHAVSLDASGSEISGAFSNANGVSFGLSANGKITGSHNALTSQSTQFRALTLGGNTAGTTTFNASNNDTLFLHGGNNITLSGNGSSVTIVGPSTVAQSNQSAIKGLGASNTGNTAGNTGLSTGIDWVLAGTNNVTISESTAGGGPNTLWISGPTTVAQSNQSAIKAFGATNTGNTAGNTGVSTGIDWVLAGTNNITISESTAGGGPNTLWVSGPTTVAQTNQSAIKGFGASNTGNTAGNTGLSTGVDWVLAGSNNVTISESTTPGGPNTLWVSGPTTVAQTNQSAIKGLGASNTGNTAGNTGLSTGVDWVVAGSNNITISESTAPGGPNTLWVSGPTTVAQSTQTQNMVAVVGAGANGTGTFSSGSMTLAAGNNITLSTGANVISIHGGAGGGGGIAAGVSNAGNTAGSTGTVSTGNFVLVGSGAVTLSQSTGAPGNAATVTFDDGVRHISSFQNMPNIDNSSLLTFGMTSLSHAAAFMLPERGSFSFMRLPLSMSTNSTTVATLASATASGQFGMTHTFNAVVYSLGTGASSQSLQSVASGSASMQFSGKISITNTTQYSISLGFTANANGGAANTNRTTQYSISNTNYSFTTNQIATEWSGGRFLDIPFATSLTKGPYWVVVGGSSNSSSAGAAGLAGMSNVHVRYSGHYGISQANLGFGIMGSTDMTSGGQLGNGFFSTNGGGTTASLPISAISSTASNPVPFFQLLRSA